MAQVVMAQVVCHDDSTINTDYYYYYYYYYCFIRQVTAEK